MRPPGTTGTKPLQIQRARLLLDEGADARFLMMHACASLGLDGVQVMDFGGVDQLGAFLGVLTELDSFASVESIGVLRDAETNGDAAFNDVRRCLEAHDLPRPEIQFRFAFPSATTRPVRTAIALFHAPQPGIRPEENLAPGTLEDLLLATVSAADLLSCVDGALTCAQNAGSASSHTHKRRLYSYLALHPDHDTVGMKLGEAAKLRVWDWDHDALAPYLEMLRLM